MSPIGLHQAVQLPVQLNTERAALNVDVEAGTGDSTLLPGPGTSPWISINPAGASSFSAVGMKPIGASSIYTVGTEVVNQVQGKEVNEKESSSVLSDLALDLAQRTAEMLARQEMEHGKLKASWTREEISGARYLLEERGYTICNVKGDGACFFRCLALALDHDQNEHVKYREQVAAYLRNRIDEKKEKKEKVMVEKESDLLLGIDLLRVVEESMGREEGQSLEDAVEAYVTLLSLRDEQADHLALYLAAKIHELDIVVHQVDGKVYKLESSDAVLTGNLQVHVFYDGRHYQYLRPKLLGARPIRPDRHDFGPLMCNSSQARFDNALKRWGIAAKMFDKATESFQKAEASVPTARITRLQSSKPLANGEEKASREEKAGKPSKRNGKEVAAVERRSGTEPPLLTAENLRKGPNATKEIYLRGPTSLSEGRVGDLDRFQVCQRESCGADVVGCEAVCAKFRPFRLDFDYTVLECEVCYASEVKCDDCIFFMCESFLNQQEADLHSSSQVMTKESALDSFMEAPPPRTWQMALDQADSSDAAPGLGVTDSSAAAATDAAAAAALAASAVATAASTAAAAAVALSVKASQPRKVLRAYKPRKLGSRLSSIMSKPYDYFVRRELDGTELGCLLFSGAQEFDPEGNVEDVRPLSMDDAFTKTSSLTTFWNILTTKELVPNAFYFVRKCADSCDGIVLVTTFSRQRRAPGAPRLSLEIAHCCASGSKGSGALLISALCTVLFTIEPDTLLRVNLPGHMSSTSDFWSKLGFTDAGSTLKKMLLKDQAWMPYMHRTFPPQLADDEQVLPSTKINDVLLESIWSKEHKETWFARDPEYKEVLDSYNEPRPPTTESRMAVINSTKSLISTLDFLGTRVAVKGNGSCWLYAVLAGVGLLEHAKPCKIQSESQGSKEPTSRDYKVSATVLRQMKVYARTTRFEMAKEHLAIILRELDALKPATSSKSGTWGGGLDTYSVLSNMLGVQIICLDLASRDTFIVYPATLDLNMVSVHMDDLKMTLTRLRTAGDRFVIVEHNGQGHFAGYVGQGHSGRSLRLSLRVLEFLGL